MQFSRIPPGLVRLTDARRGTERHVALISFWLSTVTVSTTDLTAGRFTETTPGDCSLPAAGVTWREAVTWCNSASEHEGLQPAYLIGGDTVQWNPRAEGYRLPTEAEWVHGSLGGSTGPRHGPLDQIAWTEEDGTTGPQPSAGKDANAYGLFDTLGNVWEWCWDRLDPARYGDYRVLKGGGWADPRWSCRVGVRRGNAPDAIVERHVIAPFLYRMAGEPNYVPPVKSFFVDTPPTTPFYKEISWLYSMKITTGWSDGTYRPYFITERYAVCAFLYRYDSIFGY